MRTSALWRVAYYLTLHEDSVPIVKAVEFDDAIHSQWAKETPDVFGYVKAVLIDSDNQVRAGEYNLG